MRRIICQKGMGLIELLLSAVLTALIGAIALEFYVSQHNRLILEEDISVMQQNARVVMDEIARNIRIAGFGLTSSPSIVVGNDTLKIYYNLGGKVDTVVYYISRINPVYPNLMKKVSSGAAQVFAENIDSLKFTQSGRLVNVRLIAREAAKDQNFTGDKYRRRILTSNIKVRNNI
jgi:type II secretory pathway pseudopilin PulG